MNLVPKSKHPHEGHSDHKGACCGGSDTEAKLKTAPAENSPEAQKPRTKTKPAVSSGCCGG